MLHTGRRKLEDEFGQAVPLSSPWTHALNWVNSSHKVFAQPYSTVNQDKGQLCSHSLEAKDPSKCRCFHLFEPFCEGVG